MRTFPESIGTWSIWVLGLIAGIRLAREKQINGRVIPTGSAIDESVDLAHEIYNRVFRKVPPLIERKG
jgi:hypothetical protein